MKIIRITKETMHWFETLLPTDLTGRTANGEPLFFLGAVEEKTACGVLAFTAGEIAEIEYLAVSDPFRRHGAANALLDCLCRRAARSLIPVFCTFAAADKTDPLYLLFAEREDFTVIGLEGRRVRVTREQIDRCGALAKIEARGISCERFFDRPGWAQKAFLTELRRRNLFYLDDDTIWRSLVKPLCLTLGTDDRLRAAVFIGRGPNERELTLPFAWCAPDCGGALIALFSALRRELLLEMPQGGVLTIDAVEPSSYGIVNKLFPQAEEEARYFEAVLDMDYVWGGTYDAGNDEE